MTNVLREVRKLGGRIVASNRLSVAMAVRMCCDERVLIRILESDLLPLRLSSNESVFLVFQALLTEDKLLKRLFGDLQFADKVLLQNEFVRYALTNPNMLNQAANHPSVIRAVVENRKTWQQFVLNPDLLRFVVASEQAREEIAKNAMFTEGPFVDAVFTKYVLGSDRAFDKMLSDERLLTRLLSHDQAFEMLATDDTLLTQLLSRQRTFDKILSDERLLTRLLSHDQAFEKLATDDTLLTKLLSRQRTFDKILSDERLLTRLLSHGQAFEKVATDDTLLTKLLSRQRTFDKILSDDILLGRILNHGRAIETIARSPSALQKLNSIEGVVHEIACSDSLFQRWASNFEIMEAFRRSPRLLANILNHGTVIDALAVQTDFLAQIQDSDRFMQNLLRGRRTAQRLLTDSADSDRVRAIQVFHEIWQRLKPVVDTTRANLDKELLEAAWNLNRVKDVRQALLRLITRQKTAFLAHGEMHYTDDFSLWTLIHEILLNEEYFFECDTDTPYVLDCGANFGMAIYYFKSLYPKAQITAFEPEPRFRKMAQENAKRNGFTDVDVLPYALSGEEGETTLYTSEEFPLASTLTRRRHAMGDTTTEIAVECRVLSRYLDRPVHFLKLDIEGTEDAVLEESKGKLNNVHNLFIEYHHGAGMPDGRLAKILQILDDVGFDYHMRKALSFEESTARRPIERVQEPYSLTILAKNRNQKVGD